MKYSREEFLKEVLARSSRMDAEDQKRRVRLLSAATAVLSLVMIVVITGLVRIEATEEIKTIYGSILLSPQAGGYFLVAFLAFALGVAVTLMIQKTRKKS